MHEHDPGGVWARLAAVSPDLLVAVGDDGRILAANPAARHLVGRGEQNLLDRLHPDDRARWPTAGSDIRGLEVRMGSEDDGWRWIAWSGGVDGDRRLLVGRDVTDVKVLRDQLRFADRMLAIGSLTAGLAHEINNPLAAVLANLQFAQGDVDDDADSDLKEALEDAVTGAKRISEIVVSLRGLARADEGDLGPVDVHAAVLGAVEVTTVALRRRARVERELAPVPAVTGRQGRLTQAIVNLLLNAAQALANADLSTSVVAVRTRMDESDRVVIEVEDTGPAIQPGHVDGLRLWSAHSTIEGMGGTLEAARERNRTVMRIRLPPASPG